MKVKMPRFPNMQADPMLFGLSDEAVEYRTAWIARTRGLIHLALSLLTIVVLIFLTTNNIVRIAIVVLAVIKYMPLFSVITSQAKSKAASYLADVFELEDPATAEDFIDDIAFGYGKNATYGEWAEKITINEGKISEKDEHSPIILIGGPGFVQVNLDSVALLERVDGTPEIIEPRAEPWKLGRFERLREIGKSDEIGKREYAIINLRDQFMRGLPVKSRTKDGIPLEALDIKVMFSILRKPETEKSANKKYNYDESAVYRLVYDQAIISPTPPKTAGVSFPWDTTLVPLITGEIESLITSHTLSEILASISTKEIDSLTHNEATNIQIRYEMTGEQTAVSGTSRPTPAFQSRSRITERFFRPEFQEKAAQLGISIHWIDIGTWQPPSEGIILEELKNARKLMDDNARKSNQIAQLRKQYEMKELMDLVSQIIIGGYSKSSNQGSNRKLSNRELNDLAKVLEDNQEVTVSSALFQRFSNDAATKRDTATVALDMLKAFRKEFIVAIDLINKENRSSIDKQADIARIEKVLRDIDYHVTEYNKSHHS